MKLTTDLNQMPRLSMGGSVLPLSYVPSGLHAKGGVYFTEWLLVESIPPLTSHNFGVHITMFIVITINDNLLFYRWW